MLDPMREDYTSADHTRLWEHLNDIGDRANAAFALGSSITNAFSAATGWRIDSQSLRKAFGGRLCAFNITFTRTGAAIGVNASTGNITNTAVATWQVATHPIVFGLPLSAVGTGRNTSGSLNASSGTVSLAAVGGSADIATNEQLQLSGIWLA